MTAGAYRIAGMGMTAVAGDINGGGGHGDDGDMTDGGRTGGGGRLGSKLQCGGERCSLHLRPNAGAEHGEQAGSPASAFRSKMSESDVPRV